MQHLGYNSNAAASVSQQSNSIQAGMPATMQTLQSVSTGPSMGALSVTQKRLSQGPVSTVTPTTSFTKAAVTPLPKYTTASRGFLSSNSLSAMASSYLRPGSKRAEDEETDVASAAPASAVTQVAQFDANQCKTFAVNMPNLCANWLDINQLPTPMRNAIIYLSVTNFPRSFIPNRAQQQVVFTGTKPYTLVLDLDETLMHCSPRHPSGRPDCIVHFDAKKMGSVGYVTFRPFVKLLLEVAARDFNVVVFTASTQLYADQVIDSLDPKREFINLRLYRQHCTEVGGGYTKDLRILNRSLDRVLLIDNSPVSVALQPDNSVICSSFFGEDPHDKELVDLMLLLRELIDRGKTASDICVQKYGFRKWINELRNGCPI